MHTLNELHEILYVSTIAADVPIRVVADIAVKSRSNNQRLGITGLLVFDGLHFCQQFEGGGQEVAALMERIRNDTRHTDVVVLHQGPIYQRRYSRFSLGYTSVNDVEELERLQQLRGQAAVDAFVALLATLDVDG
jgi:Sensors of blue-light using FAD